MSWVITPSNLLVDDQDALTYLTAVEAADGQTLESGVRLAVNAFVKGCKADGIWPAIKASCILAGARTRLGALTPLVGAAPSSFNFVDADYNRETGLAGNGSTKYLNSNRNNTDDPQNNQHVAVYMSSFGAGNWAGGGGSFNASGAVNFSGVSSSSFFTRSRNSLADSISLTVSGLVGMSRPSADTYTVRSGGGSSTVSRTSQSATSGNFAMFARVPGTASDLFAGRLAFYSIGESLNLALLDARVTDLINALAAAIP